MRLVTGLFVLSLFGCKQDRDVAPTPAVASTSTAKSVEPSRQIAPLIARLDYEAKHRSGAEPRAERVLDALQAADIHVDGPRQFVAATVNANYCLGGRTKAGLVVAACEYPTAKAASEGKAFMDKRFAAMAPSARRAVRGNTVLTVADPAGAMDAPAMTRALTVFAAL